MRSRNLLVVPAVLALGAFAAPVASAAVPGTAPVRAGGASRAGAYHARSMSVTIALSPRAGLDELLARQAVGHAGPITSKAFNARFAPSAATVRSVRAFARTHSLRVRSVSANRMLVGLAGSSSAFASAFRTQFATFRLPSGTTFRSPTSTAKLPAAFRSRTAAVLGLSNIGRAHLRASSVTFPTDYGPQDLWALYNAPSAATGSGQSVAIITEGDVTKPKADLVTFEHQFGLPVVPWNTVQVGPQTSDTAGNDEWDLDSQYSTGLAPNVSALYDYNGGSLSNTDIQSTITRWVTDNTTRQASFSAGECETLAQVTGFQTSLDNTLKQAAAQGQTLFTSSGDTGSFCPVGPAGVNGVPAGLPGVEYPAASPYAIGVGGTTVLGPGPNEVAWYAGGGGATYFEDVPSWQQNAGGSFAGVDRGVPDVALDADPNSGYRVIVDGSETIIGGTSASAPAWQGIWARAQAAKGGALGFAGPVIYTTEPASVFNDITVGAIGTYAATPGWDYTTGRGTPNITAFVNGA
ncbi:MAG: pseudomonalisin [Thermoleophilaceae bacterium]|jgi:subtilase family serine protease|nr:pseudomonalisin [Thermoleophilaceae bacterium]